jgi:hypothetical protein
MRLLLQHPEDYIYNKHPQQFFVWAATATVAVGAISAGVAAYSASESNKTAKAGQRSLKKQTKKTQQMAEDLPKETGQVLRGNIPDYNVAAGELTAGTLQALEQFQPGATAQRQQISESISSLLGGKLTPDMMQTIAEVGGAGFNPFTAGKAGGFQAAQALYPKGSLAALKEGMGMFQQMMGLAPAFLTTSTQAGSLATNLGGLSAAALGGSYQSGANQIVGNIALANQQNQANMGAASAIGGLAQGGLSAYQQYTTPNATGGFGSSFQAGVAAPYSAGSTNVAGMGYVPQAQATGRTYNPTTQVYSTK